MSAPSATRVDYPPPTLPSPAPKKVKPHRRSWKVAIRRDWQLYTLVVIPLAWFIIFRYLPMAGNLIAFRRYRPGGSIFGTGPLSLRYFTSETVGFLHSGYFWQVFFNTLILGGLTLLFIFPMPIVLALLLNEVKNRFLKRFVQTVSYLPHFLSIVVIVAMIFQLVSADGLINQFIKSFGGDTIYFMQKAEWFRPIYVSSEMWQTVGWGTILYLAALTIIDQDLYEASKIDGANRWRQTWHVTLPGIRPTIVTLLILNTGSFLAVGFEKILLMYNPLTFSTADVISTYVYRITIQEGGPFSLGAAIGLFDGLIGLIMVMAANGIARRTVGASLW